MEQSRSDVEVDDGIQDLTNVFTDTCILLNYIQQGVEPDHSSSLIEGDQVNIVVGVTVKEEIEKIDTRRKDIYEDFIDYLIEESEDVSEYNPDDRRPYFGKNDSQHVRSMQMKLSQLEERAEIQRQLRRFVRAARRRIEYIRKHVIPQAKFDQQPGLSVIFALDTIISNENDRNVIADAALWAAEAPGSSGVFVTMDKDHLLNEAERINSALRDTKGQAWELLIIEPGNLPSLL